jgi:phosphomannomutase
MLIRDIMNTSGVRFGTSGARGRVADMTPEVCFAYTSAFLDSVSCGRGDHVALGIDLRPSSPDIASACTAAIRHRGLEPVYCGALPTPALACFAMQGNMPAIMVTGSHIPYDRNGIKFYRAQGEISKEDEQAIAHAEIDLPGAALVMALPPVDDAAAGNYIERYTDFFAPDCLKGLKLGIYEHSSVARDLLGVLLTRLGAEVTPLERTNAFVPIDTEAVSDEDVRRGREWSAGYGFDALLSTDGDADRPLIGDEHGRWLRGDIVGLLCARALGARAVAAPVSCNTALERCGAFDTVVRTRIGSPYVIEAMQSLSQAGDGVAGFEANGGFLLGSEIVRDGRHLSALPTRDAVLPMLALLAAGKPLSALSADLPARFTASDRLQDFPTESSRALLAELSTSPAEVQALFGRQAVDADLTDGLRMFFDDGEIVHLRPSGNAPELRCYAEADSEARARELAADCLARLER